MRGRDAWLVVAPSGGINVWCAASGGHLTTHQIVTALKTSGVAARVNHRRAILPQLAATGVLALDVFRRCRWNVRFGPTRAEDLPRYLDCGGEKDDAMRAVRFGVRERLEMATAWGAPAGLLFAGIAWALRPAWSLPLFALATGAAALCFLVYDRLPEPRRPLFAAGLVGASALAVGVGGGGLPALVTAMVAGGALAILLTFDWEGSTPIEGGSHFEERSWRITLDTDRCEGVFRCWEVCPEACFEKHEDRRVVELAHDDRCIRCGACVVQCPKDALAFENELGEHIEPDVIRRFKLNLLGQRKVDAGADGAVG
jgi:NAD-dependent dihydropyrimidine dehydrogenase PreA subunit